MQELLRRKMALWTSCSVPDGVDPLQIVRRHPRSALRAGKERSVQTAVENFEFLGESV